MKGMAEWSYIIRRERLQSKNGSYVIIIAHYLLRTTHSSSFGSATSNGRSLFFTSARCSPGKVAM